MVCIHAHVLFVSQLTEDVGLQLMQKVPPTAGLSLHRGSLSQNRVLRQDSQ